MDYINTLALWLGYACLTLAAIRTVIASVMVTRSSIIELQVQLRERITDAVALACLLQERKRNEARASRPNAVDEARR